MHTENSFVLECDNLCKKYEHTYALNGVSFGVERGGIVGLLGPNGSGKTTLIKLAMGMLQATSGEIKINGLSPCPKTKAVTAYLPDANFLSEWMTVEQALVFSQDFFADFKRDRAMQMLNRLGIGLKQEIRTLSKGNKEKLSLILTMSRDAELYILDEPIAGVDPAARDFILDTIIKNKPQNSTIVLCTHLIADVEPVLTHAIFLNCGRVVLSGRVEDIREEKGKSLDEVFREVFKW